MMLNPAFRTISVINRPVFIGCHAARVNNALVMVQQRRNIRAVRKRFRQELPRYRNNLFNLEPLTEMLTINEIGKRVETLDEMWMRKLDIYKQYLPDRQRPILLEALYNPQNDIDALLRIIDDNLVTMSSFYVACSFEVLDDMMEFGKCHVDTVIVSPEFKRLATRALYKIRFFEADEVLKLMKCMATTKLPENSLLAQTAFQMTRFLINDFNMDELQTLSRCLEKFQVIDTSSKSLLLALKQAIPIAQRYQEDELLLTKSAKEKRRLELNSGLTGRGLDPGTDSSQERTNPTPARSATE